MKRLLFLSLALLTIFAVSVPRATAQVNVSVGYADNTRSSPFFPLPWSGSAGVQFFYGNPMGAQATLPAGSYDSGAIMLTNTSATTSFTLESISVHVPSWSGAGIGTNTATNSNEWAAFTFPVTVLAGQSIILTQDGNIAGNNEFDTSDPGSGSLNATNNCDPGNAFAIANAAFCASIAPTVTVKIDGVSTTLTDSGQVLDTGGFDVASGSSCPGGLGTPGACNESLQWRPIGTTGIGNPGNTPEPGSLILLGTGIASLAMRRRKQAN
jgi:hypothetical protein